MPNRRQFLSGIAVAPLLARGALAAHSTIAAPIQRCLYVATPGIRNYLEHGGHGILVYDIDDGHKLLRRIKSGGIDEEGQPRNVKGIAASAETGRLYVSTTHTLQAFDLATDEPLWERAYDGGCDRMAIAPDGSVLYVPSFEGPTWHVVDGLSGDVVATLEPDSGAHNTVFGPDGREVYLAGLRSPLLSVATTDGHRVARTVGPFSAPIRPFTVNRAQTLGFLCVNELLGFEVADLKAGTKRHRVEVEGFEPGPVKRHGCPSHGVGLTPDERELWLCDGHNQRLHVFDSTVMPPRQVASLPLKDEPGWVTFTVEGDFAYPSTGDVIEPESRAIVAELLDEEGRPVQSEKLVEVDFRDGKPAGTGDQFGIGRAGAKVAGG